MAELPEQFMLAGLPGSGKTSFLVALWHVVESEEVPNSLVLKAFFEGDREYIQKARERWLRYEPVVRNTTDASGPIQFSLSERGGEGDLRLTIPDLAGETFRQQFLERTWSEEFEERLSGVTGLLLFINPDNVDEPLTIAEADAALATDGLESAAIDDDPEEDEYGAEEEPDEDEESFALAHCCTAVKLVDLVQFLAAKVVPAPIPVAVVISAYDSLDGTPYQSDPELYMRQRVGLLDQYLRANPERFHVQAFGLSAQGADYEMATAVAELQNRINAAERIRVVTTGRADHHDASAPIRWLAAFNGARR
jgi:hypothetical protein